MRKRTMLRAAGLVVFGMGLGWVACASETGDGTANLLSSIPTGGDPLVTYLDETYGIRVSGLKATLETTVEEDGAIVTTGLATLDVDGLGSRVMDIEEYIYSEAAGEIVLAVAEDESGDERYFEVNLDESWVAFSNYLTEDRVRGVAVGRNVDGSYTVWKFDDEVDGGRDREEIVDDGYEALQIVQEYAEFNTITPHVMLMAIALAHTEMPEARTPSSCTNTALGPPVCALFKEFCDCAACSVLGQTGGACSLCPKL